ncbi:MAG: type II toxin-antitoxin system prevent-host-death family antitoxin [Candidatus Hydrogenedentes bacterium]|nr:type II toxin-antitoxin system prevent-host-death family antitoxin [Candidatus Hydrogenedentota bacterium]
MKATVLDMRRDPKKILDAIARNETVTLSYRGKPIARIEPLHQTERCGAADHPAFGMWADREDLTDPSAFVRELRKGRFGAV